MSRRGRKRKTFCLSKKDWILIGSIILSFLLYLFLSMQTILRIQTQKAIEKDVTLFANRNTVTPFRLDKIVLFSSCDAVRNDTPKALWDLNPYQYTDIAIYIDNQSENGLTSENAITALWIDHISFGKKPELGTPSLYYINSNDFGKSNLKEENKIQERFDYTIVSTDEEIDSTKPMLYDSCQTPLTLEFANENIKTNAIISNETSLTFDGTLLSKIGVPLNSIRSSVAFHINITNGDGITYVCPVSLEIPLEDEANQSIVENGSVTITMENLSQYEFYQF